MQRSPAAGGPDAGGRVIPAPELGPDQAWDLLHADERRALAQCSVFRGGFSLEAAEAVLVVGEGGPGVVDLLQSLCERSLARTYEPPGGRGQLRFGLSESIRKLAAKELSARGETPATEARHTLFYLAEGARLAEQANSPTGAEALCLLALEAENLMAARDRTVRNWGAPPSAKAPGPSSV